jgi:hypothetical protein
LSGVFPDDSPDAARTAAVISKSFSNHRAIFGANFGADSSSASCETFPANCPDTARKLPVYCPDDSPDIAPVATPDAARKLRGRCSYCGLIF